MYFNIIDGNSIFMRYAFALPERVDLNGFNVAGVYGFTKFMLNLLSEKQPVVVVFDKCRNNFRKKICENYKANRPKPCSNIILQLEMAVDFIKNINLPCLFHDEYEADDLIGSVVAHRKDKVRIFTTDKDFLQLVNANVVTYNPFSGVVMDPESVLNKYQVSSSNFGLFLALCGDSCDNVPGIRGVGPKIAAKILKETTDPTEMQKRFKNHDFSPLDKMIQLTKIKTDIDLPKIEEVNHINWKFVREFIYEKGFHELEKFIEII